MANEAIGLIECPFTKTESEVRRNKNGGLYIVGLAGHVYPNMPHGQRWIKDNMKNLNTYVEDERQGNLEGLDMGDVQDAEPEKPVFTYVDKKPKEDKTDDGWGW